MSQMYNRRVNTGGRGGGVPSKRKGSPSSGGSGGGSPPSGNGGRVSPPAGGDVVPCPFCPVKDRRISFLEGENARLLRERDEAQLEVSHLRNGDGAGILGYDEVVASLRDLEQSNLLFGNPGLTIEDGDLVPHARSSLVVDGQLAGFIHVAVPRGANGVDDARYDNWFIDPERRFRYRGVDDARRVARELAAGRTLPQAISATNVQTFVNTMFFSARGV